MEAGNPLADSSIISLGFRDGRGHEEAVPTGSRTACGQGGHSGQVHSGDRKNAGASPNRRHSFRRNVHG